MRGYSLRLILIQIQGNTFDIRDRFLEPKSRKPQKRSNRVVDASRVQAALYAQLGHND